ncbi:MAG: hypothetical protein M1522_00625 [Actinobacteria bacterium]|nr:hypothetical protein [Actinomycetota bacterium]
MVDRWCAARWPGVTSTTRALLEHWTNPEWEPRMFFCSEHLVATSEAMLKWAMVGLMTRRLAPSGRRPLSPSEAA